MGAIAPASGYYTPYGLAGTIAAALSSYNTPRSVGTMKRARMMNRTAGALVKRRRVSGKGYSLKEAIRQVESARHLPNGDNSNAVAMKHNKVYTQNLMKFIVQGTSQGTRQGDTVFIEAIKFRGTWETPSATVNGLNLRLMVLYHDDYYDVGQPTVDNLLVSDLAMITTGTARATNLIIDPKRCTIIDDRNFTVVPSISGAVDTQSWAYTVPIKKSFTFQPSSQEGKDRNLYFVIVSTVALGVTGTSDTGSVYNNYDVIFKNSN